jgi:ABC-type branched-subunit amino acid transport system ATPase component
VIYLEATDITAGYGRLPIVHEVSIRAESGKVTALIGPNGAGKSTFLKAICGLMPSMTGHVQLIGKEVSGFRPHRLARAGMAYVPQVNNVFSSLSIKENLELGALAATKGQSSRMQEVLELFPDLATAQSKAGGDLSGGQRNMLGIARALMIEPKVLLLDEPTAGLAPLVANTLWDRIGAIARTGTAVVIVEQNVDALMEHAHWLYVLVAGRVRFQGAPAEITRDRVVQLFLGAADSASNGSGFDGIRADDGKQKVARAEED